ncbi:MAG: RecX family transcriptional regulator [Lachnospiraceae bacterium]|nr:RecX family transcriptional regulator [Lachnospiraceae bacterium]
MRPEEYEEIMKQVLPKRAMDRAYKLLMSRDYTVKQLREKLAGDEYPEEIIDDTVEKLKEQKYLDDDRFAENYIFWKSKTKSRKRMMMDLKQRGIDFDFSSNKYDELLGKNDIDSEEEIIRVFLDKKGFSPELATFEEKQKMMQTLLRKGFSYESIHHILGYSAFS